MILSRTRKKPDFFAPTTSHSKKARKSSDAEEIQQRRRPLQTIVPFENLLVWAFFKGFGWWPARIADRSELDGPLDPPNDPTRWIRWFGDNKFSEVLVCEIAFFHEFDGFFSQTRFNRNSRYRLAIIEALQVASNRSGNHFSGVEEAVAWALQDFLPGGYQKILPEIRDDVKEMMKEFDPAKIKVPRKHQGDESQISNRIKQDMVNRRNKAVQHVRKKLLKIEEICLRCGEQVLVSEHPIFNGGLCPPCKKEYLDAVLSMNGKPVYCNICGGDKDIVCCGTEECNRSFCTECVTVLMMKTSKSTVSKRWMCLLCTEHDSKGLLVRRQDWMEKLQKYLTNATEYDLIYENPVVAKKKKLRVLSLFDGISAGLLALKALNFDIECYYASEIDRNALTISHTNHPEIVHVGDICSIDNKQLLEWGPFDLLLGGSPCNDLAMVNPLRKGLWSDEGSGWLFFEYFRILNACCVIAANNHAPFFWLFENVSRMDVKTKETISRYFQVNPVLLDASKVSAASRQRLFWGNLPGMTRPMIPRAADRLTLQECLENGRVALVEKVGTITTNADTVSNKAFQEKYPVLDAAQKQKDMLWLSEIERAFGLPDHYTDKSNISCTNRRAVLGRTWSVPVIRHLLEPLREFYLS